MSWRQPKTWLAESITLAKLNTEIRDQFLALKDPPTEIVDMDYTGLNFPDESSAGWSAHPDYQIELSTEGGDILVSFQACVNGTAYLDIGINGSRYGGPDGLQGSTISNSQLAMYILLTDKPAATYTIELYVKGSFTFHKYHCPQLFVREIS